MVLACVLLAGCEGGLPKVVVRLGEGDTTAADVLRPFLIATDDAEATAVGVEILKAGGSAGDAGVAVALALGVTLPSSAGLGARGACLVHNAVSGATDALDFTAPALAHTSLKEGRTPLTRALFTLHGTLGTLPWAKVVAPAANLARFGHAVSSTLADRLSRADALLNDGAALAVFMSPRRQLLSAGEMLRQPGLAVALDGLRAMPRGAALASVLPWRAPEVSDDNDRRVFTLRQIGPQTDGAAADGATAFVVGDAKGNAVACALTMGRAFGRGVMTDGVLVASDELTPLNPVIAVDRKGRVVEARASAGPRAAALANMFSCGLDNDQPQCEARADPRGAGDARAGQPGAP
jgi:gamma-glutamyltranspeptidase